jgi:hypothetical protein
MNSKPYFRFVAEHEVITAHASNVLDAWLVVERLNERGILPDVFKTRLIAAYTASGKLVDTKTFDQWHNALMTDTYGPEWRDVIASLTVVVE